MADAGAQRGEKWWNIAKALAFELKPFSMPTRQDVVNAVKSVRTNVGQITAEVKRVAPEAVRVVKGFNPLKTLGLFSWLCGWALFIWLEFGKSDPNVHSIPSSKKKNTRAHTHTFSCPVGRGLAHNLCTHLDGVLHL